MYDEEEESGSKKKYLIVTILIIAISAGLIWFINVMLAKPVETPKKTVQEIKVIRPPPPPPEVEEEPPPPPEEEEVEVPDPIEENIPDLPDAEPPPGEQLGLDAEGGAGGDAFGLLGKKGGRSLISGGSGSRFAWYSNIVKSDILDSLYEDEKLRTISYRVKCDIWLNRSGGIRKFNLLNSTGDAEIDMRIKDILNSIEKISDQPPADMPMPIRLSFVSR